MPSKKTASLLEKTGGKCCYCNKILTDNTCTVEHVWTRELIAQKYLVRLTANRRTKLIRDCLPACKRCNNSRGELTCPIEYAKLKNSRFIKIIEGIYKRDPIELSMSQFKRKKIKTYSAPIGVINRAKRQVNTMEDVFRVSLIEFRDKLRKIKHKLQKKRTFVCLMSWSLLK